MHTFYRVLKTNSQEVKLLKKITIVIHLETHKMFNVLFIKSVKTILKILRHNRKKATKDPGK